MAFKITHVKEFSAAWLAMIGQMFLLSILQVGSDHEASLILNKNIDEKNENILEIVVLANLVPH